MSKSSASVMPPPYLYLCARRPPPPKRAPASQSAGCTGEPENIRDHVTMRPVRSPAADTVAAGRGFRRTARQMARGVAIPEVREQLFAAADRVLARDGPAGLTTRAVTAEAGVANGVMHRHFRDLDEFL